MLYYDEFQKYLFLGWTHVLKEYESDQVAEKSRYSIGVTYSSFG